MSVLVLSGPQHHNSHGAVWDNLIGNRELLLQSVEWRAGRVLFSAQPILCRVNTTHRANQNSAISHGGRV